MALWDSILNAIIGGMVNTGLSMAANRIMAPRPQRMVPPTPALPPQPMFQAPEVRELIKEARVPIRTPEQERSDITRVQGQEAALQSYRDLAAEYEGLKTRGPLWNPYEESQIKQTVAGKHALRGTAESGAYFEDLRQALDEYRLKKSAQFEQSLGQLRGQMTPYLNVLGPAQPSFVGAPAIPTVGGRGGTEAYAPRTSVSPVVSPAIPNIFPILEEERKKKERPEVPSPAQVWGMP